MILLELIGWLLYFVFVYGVSYTLGAILDEWLRPLIQGVMS